MKNIFLLLTMTLIVSLTGCRSGQQQPPPTETEQFRTQAPKEAFLQNRFIAAGKRYAIADQSQESSEVAREIIKKGGNIFDATVAVSLVQAVVRPQSTGIFGGGFALLHSAKKKKVEALDFRERAPRKAHRDMFLDKKGELIKDASTDTPQAAGVPGMLRGLEVIHKTYGSGHIKWRDLVEPAIRIATDGFVVTGHLANALSEQKDQFAKTVGAELWRDSAGATLGTGARVKNPNQAKLLLNIASGAEKFYTGSLAQSLSKKLSSLGALIDEKDLRDYKVKWRTPVSMKYKGFDIWSMPPPSSGGIHVLQILKMLENDIDAQSRPFSPDQVNLVVQASQRAFVDRARYLGDPDFFKVPVDMLLSSDRLKELRSGFKPDRAQKADELLKLEDLVQGGNHTMHFSMMDADGNSIAITESMNSLLGSAIYLPEFGIFLNNTMDDFSAKPGAANIYGALGAKANEIAPGKTPLSSTAPTIVFKDGQPVLSLGAPGGTRIISCIYQTLLRRLAYQLSLEDSISLARFHHQWRPDVLEYEFKPEFTPVLQSKLKSMGYELKESPIRCRVMAVENFNGSLKAVADPRDDSDHALAW